MVAAEPGLHPFGFQLCQWHFGGSRAGETCVLAGNMGSEGWEPSVSSHCWSLKEGSHHLDFQAYQPKIIIILSFINMSRCNLKNQRPIIFIYIMNLNRSSPTTVRNIQMFFFENKLNNQKISIKKFLPCRRRGHGSHCCRPCHGRGRPWWPPQSSPWPTRAGGWRRSSHLEISPVSQVRKTPRKKKPATNWKLGFWV